MTQVPSHGGVGNVRALCALSLSALLWLAGCAATPQTDALVARFKDAPHAPVEVKTVPFFPQDQYQCGPAALATTLVYSGVETTPQALTDMVYVPERHGSFQYEMLAAARRNGRIPYVIEPEMEGLLTHLDDNRPVLVLQNLGTGWYPRWHYAVVVGADIKAREVVLRSGEIRRRITPMGAFENTWRRSQYWGFVLLKPGEVPAGGRARDYFLAVSDFARDADTSDVLAALEAGIVRWPGSRALHIARANLLYETGQLEQAEQAYKRLLDMHPDFAPAHNNLAALLAARGALTEARGHVRKAIALGGPFRDEYRKTLAEIELR